MKKYKLIKEYPGSEKLNTILEVIRSDNTIFTTNGWLNLSLYPEYWELVIEKDYEILSISLHRSDKPKITNMIGCSEDYILSLLNCNGNSIHSIKRTSDGEIFTINDNTNYGIIKNIHVNGDTFCIISKDFTVYNSVKTILKVKQLLFTTEDSVDIFEGDIFWNVGTLYSLNEYQIINNKYNLIFLKDGSKQFSTKEKAEEYILYNKPLLTLKDIDELLCKNTSSYFLEKFKKRAQKLNNKN